MRPEHFDVGLLLIVPAIAVVIFLAVFGLHFVARRARAEEERSKLFEMGYYLPRRPSRWPQALFCTLLGVGVPVATLQVLWGGPRTPDTQWTWGVWVVGCIISVAAIAGATVVASIVFFRPESSAEPQKLPGFPGKPASDPDALDFAGRLGRG